MELFVCHRGELSLNTIPLLTLQQTIQVVSSIVVTFIFAGHRGKVLGKRSNLHLFTPVIGVQLQIEKGLFVCLQIG